jgi:hypothetical protein
MWHPQRGTLSGKPETRVTPEFVKDINRNFQSLSFYYCTGLQKEQLVLKCKSMRFVRYQSTGKKRACSGFSRRVKNGSFFAIFHLFSVT